MKYKGEKCAACGKEFTEDDDVVVCPECGSPLQGRGLCNI